MSVDPAGGLVLIFLALLVQSKLPYWKLAQIVTGQFIDLLANFHSVCADSNHVLYNQQFELFVRYSWFPQ